METQTFSLRATLKCRTVGAIRDCTSQLDKDSDVTLFPLKVL